MTSSFLPIHAPLKLTPGLRLGPCSSNSSRTFSLLPGLSWNSTKNFIIHLGLGVRQCLLSIDDRCCGPNIGAGASAGVGNCAFHIACDRFDIEDRRRQIAADVLDGDSVLREITASGLASVIAQQFLHE